jgi:hypothetical protein
MTSSHRRPALLLALSLGALAPAAPASAAVSGPTVSVDKACYVNSATHALMTISGAGFAPGDTVRLTAGDASATATAAGDGTFTATSAAPDLPKGPFSKRLTLTAVDQTRPGVTAETTIHVANLAVAVSQTLVQNVRKDKVLFSFSGFEPGRRIYAFYIHGKRRARAVFNRAQGPCGTLRERALLYPGGRPTNDRYTVVFENTGRYSATAFPRVTGNLKILHF